MRLIDEALAGNKRALARLATHIENDTEIGQQAVAALYARTGRAHIVGITGPPGAGKSTLVNALIGQARADGRRVGVLAIDPTSPLSGGAVLGDRIRMLERHGDEGVFIRSLASRGRRGGLAPAISGLIHLLDAVGFDLIIIETVGVGQEEVDAAAVVHTLVLVQMPRSGDAVQVLKAGVLELADIFVVNKADLGGAEELARELRGMVAMAPSESRWRSPVIVCSAVSGQGIDDVLAAIDDHRRYLTDSGELARRQQSIAAAEVKTLVASAVDRLLRDSSASVAPPVEDVAQRRQTPRAAALEIIRSLALNR